MSTQKNSRDKFDGLFLNVYDIVIPELLHMLEREQESVLESLLTFVCFCYTDVVKLGTVEEFKDWAMRKFQDKNTWL